MCHICNYIKDNKPSLKELDLYKSINNNIVVLKSHHLELAKIALDFCPKLVVEIKNEKNYTSPSSTN